MQPPQIPGYRLVQEIGQGGAGVVWFAREAMTGVRRAVKILPKVGDAPQAHIQRELRGIREYQRVSRGHPHLVQIYHVDQTPLCYFYVMEAADPLDPPSAIEPAAAERKERPLDSDRGEYVPRTLAAIMERSAPLHPATALEYIEQILRGLHHLHSQGLMHRDVKPANILVIDGRMKLCDVGLVTSMERDVTQVGTPGYMPPRDARLDATADVYSAGIVLYEMITAMHRDRFPELPVFAGKKGRRWRELRTAIAISNRAASLDRRLRYPSIEAFLRDVEARRAPRSGRAKKTGFAVAAAVLVATFGILLGSMWFRPPRPAAFVHASAAKDDLEHGVLKLHFGDDSVMRVRMPTAINKPVVWKNNGGESTLVVAGSAGPCRLYYFQPPDSEGELRDDQIQSIDLWKLPPWNHQEFARSGSVGAPLLADLDGKPGDELVVTVAYANCPTRIVVFTHGWQPLSEYWHYGQMGECAAADLAGDSKPELVCWGLANARPPGLPFGAVDELYHSAMIVLDPRSGGGEPGHWSMNPWMNASSRNPPLAYGHLASNTEGFQGMAPWAISNVSVFENVVYPVRISLQGCGFFDLASDLTSAGEHRGIDLADPKYASLPPPHELWLKTWPPDENTQDYVTDIGSSSE